MIWKIFIRIINLLFYCLIDFSHMERL